MPKQSSKVAITCESCEEQDAVKKVDDLGFVCADCLHSYETMEDDETNLGELDDDEIDELLELDETENEDDEDLVLSAHELRRQGFLLDDNREDEY